jgi:hypothetical protein
MLRAGHDVQAEEPARPYVFAGQPMQEVPLGDAYCPAGHAVQLASTVPPVASL